MASSTNSVNNCENSGAGNANNNSSNQLHIDDIEIMKQRSANNNTFLCIKIPEIQLLVSYKGSNMDKKNIKDLNNVCLLFPLFEVHDQTWTWLDLINALKSHVKKALLSQALKHKLIKVPIQPVNKLINRKRRSSSSQQQLTNLQIEEHEKLAMLKLFGTKFIEKNSQFNYTTQVSQICANKEEASSKAYADNEDLVSEKVARNKSNPSSFNEKESLVRDKKPSVVDERVKPTVVKSNSSLGFGLKKHFFKLTREKTMDSAISSSSSKCDHDFANEGVTDMTTVDNLKKAKRKSAPK